MRSTWRRGAAVLALAGLILAGCGGANDGGSDESAGEAATSEDADDAATADDRGSDDDLETGGTVTLGDRTWKIDAEGLTIEECRVNADANDYVSLSLTAADDPDVKEFSVESTAVMFGVTIELSDATWNGAYNEDDFTIDGRTLEGRAMMESSDSDAGPTEATFDIVCPPSWSD